MKKLVAVFILICLAITLMHATAFAQDGEVTIVPYRWDNSTVYSDQFIYLHAGWGACRLGAIQAFRSATHISWTLEKAGEVVNNDEATRQFWGSIHPITPQPDICLGNTPESILAISWDYPLGQLEAGDYSLHFVWWLDHPVTDLGDTDGNGRPDFYYGLFQDVELSIHVEDR